MHTDYSFTKREVEVLNLLSKGYSDNEISRNMLVSSSIVRTNLETIYSKLDVSNRVLAVLKAHSLGIIKP